MICMRITLFGRVLTKKIEYHLFRHRPGAVLFFSFFNSVSEYCIIFSTKKALLSFELTAENASIHIPLSFSLSIPLF